MFLISNCSHVFFFIWLWYFLVLCWLPVLLFLYVYYNLYSVTKDTVWAHTGIIYVFSNIIFAHWICELLHIFPLVFQWSCHVGLVLIAIFMKDAEGLNWRFLYLLWLVLIEEILFQNSYKSGLVFTYNLWSILSK